MRNPFEPAPPRTRIQLSWVQKGHTTRDPCGHRSYALTATWSNSPADQVNADYDAAIAYAKGQNWISWEVEKVPA